MFIHEAVSVAFARGYDIKRTNSAIWKKQRLRPTNDSEGFIVIKPDPEEGERRAPRWQPQADDLLADDWVLVTPGYPGTHRRCGDTFRDAR